MFKELSVVEKIELQFNAKTFSGKALLEVPSILKETGNWSEEHKVPLKLLST